MDRGIKEGGSMKDDEMLKIPEPPYIMDEYTKDCWARLRVKTSKNAKEQILTVDQIGTWTPSAICIKIG